MNKRAFHPATLLAVAAFTALCISFATHAAGGAQIDAAQVAPSARVALPGHVLPALAMATMDQSKSKAVTDNEQLTLTLVLNRTDQSGFESYLTNLYDPRSVAYRRFLNQRELADRFGPTQKAYDEVRDWLMSNGLVLVEASANRLTLSVKGTRARVEQSFGIAINDHKVGERILYANDRDPSLPGDLARNVQSIAGLSNAAIPGARPAQRGSNYGSDPAWDNFCSGALSQPGLIVTFFAGVVAYGSVTGVPFILAATILGPIFGSVGGLAALGIATLPLSMCAAYAIGVNYYYDYPPPLQSSLTVPKAVSVAAVNNQKIGLVEFDTFHVSDVKNWLSLIRADPAVANRLSAVPVNGGVSTPGAGESEVLLDIAAVMLTAPSTNVSYVVYHAPPHTSFQQMFNAMINDGVTVISNSWSECEDQHTIATVLGIDSVLAQAAASGISVFNGSGDSGSTCLNGSPNTVGVPASSPHATAIGGTTPTLGPGYTYGGETWWDGSGKSPPTGKGGFGVSRFFARPAYQDGLSASPMRSVPDLSVVADPRAGLAICQDSAGGCPTGLSYGGTSMSAPLMAGMVATLNQNLASNLGGLNPVVYPLANTLAFNSAASMGTDFGHVGLGSPNLNYLHLALSNQTIGAASTNSIVSSSNSVFADGVAIGIVQVNLSDAKGYPVRGKVVSLTPNSATNAIVSAPSGLSDTNGGAVVFQVTNTAVENVTFTATDVTDGVTLTKTATIKFVTPLAAGGSIVAVNGSAPADGVSTATIVVTLQDSLGRPTPGKLISLAAAGNAVIKGPSPSVTDANGQIQFTTTNTKVEGVFFIATDVTDGDLRVPGVAFVNFTTGGGDNCGNTNMGDPNINAASGYAIKSFATGFTPRSVFFGNIGPGCRGATGLAFDAAGNLFVAFSRTGDIYKFGATGGAAGPATLVTPTALGPGLLGLTFGLDGKLYGAFQATTGDFFTGAVKEINPVTGAVVRTVSTPITCASYIATDPLSGDLFVDDSCGGAGSDNGSIWRINSPGSASPTTTVYAATPGINGGLTFSAGGTLYVLSYTQNSVAKISGTNKPQPPTVTVLPGLTGPALNVVALGAQPNGDARTLLLSNQADPSGFPAGIKAFDTTGNPVTTTALLVNNAFASVQITGPDGCQYASMSVAVYKITNADGSCPLAIGNPSLVLSPPAIAPNPAQGSAKSFTATFHYTSAPAGTPVLFFVTGANTLQRLLLTDATGKANFSYTGINVGTDTIAALGTANGLTLTSNLAKVTWANGVHVTSLDVNLSPTGGFAGTRTTLSATLVDVSVTPVAAIAGATVQLAVGSQSCSGVTNTSGVASCSFILTTVGNLTLTASYAGSGAFSASSASTGFTVVAPTKIDIDGNGSVDALTDGLLIQRWLAGLAGTALTNAAVGTGATRITPADITAYLTALRPVLDVDGNGQFDAATDGLLIVRYLFGLRGDALIAGGVAGGAPRNSSAAIETYIQGLLP